jgi:hypothetical protein
MQMGEKPVAVLSKLLWTDRKGMDLLWGPIQYGREGSIRSRGSHPLLLPAQLPKWSQCTGLRPLMTFLLGGYVVECCDSLTLSRQE